MIGKMIAATTAMCCCLIAVACSDGTNGSKGSTGASGVPGASVIGPIGDSGAPGSPGNPGAPGEAGVQGDVGVVSCGSVEIQPADYNSACGVCPGVSGTVQCQLASPATDAGDGQQLTEVCANADGQFSDVFVSASTSSMFPANPVSDPVGVNVALSRAALTFVSPVQNNEADSGNATVFLAGLCSTAQTHCESGVDYQMSVSNGVVNLCGPDGSGFWTDLGFPETTGVAADLVGVQMTDFYPGFTNFDYRGAPESCVETEAGVVCTSLLSSQEQLLGLECTDGSGTVRLWSCSVNAAGQAVVGCTGQAL